MKHTQAWPAGSSCAVLGAGVVGIACAIELAQAGMSVDLIDRGEPGGATTAGTAGLLLASQIEPLTDWKLVRSLPILLMKRDSELILRKDYLKQLKPWLVAYAKACMPARVEHSRIALASLNRIAIDAWEDLAGRAGMSELLVRNGVIFGYTKRHAWEDAAPKWALKKEEFGIDWNLLGASDIKNYVPAVADNLYVALFAKQDAIVTDPRALVDGIAAYAVAQGVNVVRDELQGITRSEVGTIKVQLADGVQRDYDGVVVALGAWSGKFADMLGDSVPLDVQRGYNFTYPDAQIKMRYPLLIDDCGLALTAMGSGLRFGGWAEFGGLQLPPATKVFARLSKVAKELLKGLHSDGAQEWMGHRPCMPDSVPVIGHGTRGENILYAFGHGNLGLTQAAATARCIASLATGTQSPVQIELFSPKRFAG